MQVSHPARAQALEQGLEHPGHDGGWVVLQGDERKNGIHLRALADVAQVRPVLQLDIGDAFFGQVGLSQIEVTL